ncbi:dGTP triphosphohydrolase [Thermodesulfobacteriota bacterium]
MCLYSDFFVELENEALSPYALHSDDPWYAEREYTDSNKYALDPAGDRSRYRTSYEIDKDRINNSQAFRRMEYKTQVFVTHEGDNFRTRLTHSLEVSEIARHIARALRLNEHVVEAISLGHDIGHAPYGHSGEDAINSWLIENHPDVAESYYFCHNRNSLEIVEHLEPGYDWDSREAKKKGQSGLNLTRAVREGILVHTARGYRGLCHEKISLDNTFEESIRKLSKSNINKGLSYPGSLEAQVVRISDDLAQRVHDLEDGFRTGMLDGNVIRKTINKYFTWLDGEVLGRNWVEKNNGHLVHKDYKTKVSKLFLSDIVSMYIKNEEKKDPYGYRNYSRLTNEVRFLNDRLNSNIKEDRAFQAIYRRAAMVAFLLHMWRDRGYLSSQDEQEQIKLRTRILKYFSLLQDILSYRKNIDFSISAQRVTAFLRGIMLANVIEHSYYNLHTLLDDNFRHIDESQYLSKVKRIETLKENEKYYAAFVVTQGTYDDNEIYHDAIDEHRLNVWHFSDKKQMEVFLKTNLGDMMTSNGKKLAALIQNSDNHRFAKCISWINKSTRPTTTSIVKIQFKRKVKWVPISHIRIYFTGYKDLCPCIDTNTSQCDYQEINDQMSKCSHYKKETTRPDVDRIIDFNTHMFELDIRLENVITQCIHQASRIARMNFVGKKIVNKLLNTYTAFPRAMNDRVWNRLRVYKDRAPVNKEVRNIINARFTSKSNQTISKEALQAMLVRTKPNHKNSKYSMIRRIVEHVSGMTDRYISLEYNRLTQSGREAELQDESYE